ncbi:outer membrane protein [Halobacteriovorax sp. HLS]|uniref:outer membrane protein n=1 Tax=Halobacteriovorax sp. HLS TaxID=2234000 RepID=UPI000FDA3E9C|nr:hypothetical protein [Halobacteriovorax sp. HLS]
MKIFSLIILLFSINTYANESMRRCMILPIKDSVGGAIGFKVYERVEKYLRRSEWCYYKHNSEIINILGNYKKNLDEHLANPEVIKIVAQKTKAGSIIKASVESVGKGVNVSLEVLGDNGTDVYFKEKLQLTTNDPVMIAQTIMNWLDLYEKNIPYDGRILGVLGNQFTVDLGKGYGVFQNDDVEILRPIKKKKHPLFKEIVDWETEKLADGKIFYVSVNQSQGKIDKYVTRKRAEINDWVIVKKDQSNTKNLNNLPYDQDSKNDFKFGKLGTAAIFATLGSGKISSSTGSDTRNMSGTLFGVNLDVEVWATRNIWTSFELGAKFGTYSKSSGNLTTNENSAANRILKLKVGYKYLPLGFFYGPQLDGYVGYAGYNYGVDSQVGDRIGEVSFNGLLLGGRGSIPIMKKFRAYLGIEFMLTSSYTEEVFLYGQDESSKHYSIELGTSYAYSPNMAIEGGVDFNSNEAEFAGGESLSFKDTNFKAGVRFNF